MVKTKVFQHLLPLIAIFIIISLFWIFVKVSYYEFVFLFLGLGLGSFFLDVDHLIYWLYLKPNTEESRLAQIAFHHHDFRSLLKLLQSTVRNHNSLIFHHFFFQIVLAIISLFVFTSSDNTFGMAFLLSLNLHLVVDEVEDYFYDQRHLQEWLFARESKQLPLKYLSRYLYVFIFLSFVFTWLLLKSKS